MYGIQKRTIKGESYLVQFSCIDKLIDYCLEHGVDPSAKLWVDGGETDEELFEYMVL